MEIKVFNENNLRDDEIDIVITRVKIYLINSNNEIIVASSNGGIQLPGGHVEEGEDSISACIREIKEETGIVLEKDVIPEPFFEIRHYMKNYKNLGVNRVAKIMYYFIKTDQIYEEQNTKLTENEKANNFEIRLIPYSNFEQEMTVVKNTNSQEINRVIAGEILESFLVLKRKFTFC